MFYVQLAPLGGILGSLKSYLGTIFAIFGDLFYKAKTHFLQKGPFPPTDLAENLFVDSQTPSGSKSKGLQMGNSGSKNFIKAGGGPILSCSPSQNSPQLQFSTVMFPSTPPARRTRFVRVSIC